MYQLVMFAIIVLLGFYASLVIHDSAAADITSTAPSKVNPPCGVIQWTCAAVTIFNKCFLGNVQKSSTLSNLFDLTKLTQREEADGLFYVSSIMAQRKQDNRSPFIANLAVRDLAVSKNPLTFNVMTSAYSNGASKFLQFTGVLDQHNACSLGRKYADSMSRSAKLATDSCIPKSKASALAIGYEDFMEDLGLFSPENNMKMALFFSNEFLFQRDNQNSHPVYNEPIAEDSNEVETEPVGLPFREDLCEFHPPAVKAFNDVFQSAAKESAVLRNLFDVNNVTVADFSSGTFYNYQYYLSRAWNQGAAQLALSMASSLSGVETLSFELIVDVYSNIASKFLYSEKRLMEGNANGLAKMYIKMLEEATLFIVDNSFIKSKSVALVSGFVNYMRNLGLFTNLKGANLAFYFANEWRCRTRANNA